MSRRKTRVWGLIGSDGEVVMHHPNQKEVRQEHKNHDSIHTGVFKCELNGSVIQTEVFSAGFLVTAQHHASILEHCRAYAFGLR